MRSLLFSGAVYKGAAFFGAPQTGPSLENYPDGCLVSDLNVPGLTHGLLSNSFLGVPYSILDMNHKKQLLRSLWVGSTVAEHQEPQRNF